MNRWLAKLNPRERRLAVATISVLVGASVFVMGFRADGHLRALDAQIDQLEQELRTLTRQNAQFGAVETAYRAVVAGHSSELTKEEIHDNLRREIFELAKTQVPGKDGGPPREVMLVRIPTLREGTLKEDGEGYREYQIEFRIPSTRIGNLMRFLRGIETSSQLLRVDRFDLMRAPDSTSVQVSLEITRTVLDSPAPDDGPRRVSSAAGRNALDHRGGA